MTVTATQTLVVGAGPTGLTLAYELRRRGVACRVVKRLPWFRRQSRGKGVQPRTLEVFDALYVIRPDGHVGFRRQPAVPAPLRHVSAIYNAAPAPAVTRAEPRR
jgi:2-polyprenyl-6-methoxyphenol hydroxylase-like FAD-dependent oxidoreductase